MSEDNRKRPCILRVLPTVDARVRAYAARQGLAPNVAAEALINGAAAEIVALGNEVARLEQREKDIITACERVADGGQFRADIIGASRRIKDERDTATRAADTLRAGLESAREATRRADAALESSHRSNRILAGRADAAEAEVARLTRELAGDRLKTEAAQAREQQARTEAADLQVRRSSAAPCACAMPDDLAARVKARIAARPGRDFAFVVKNGCDRLEGSDRYVDKKKAERMELDQ